MRIYTFAFLASTAVPTTNTGASGVSGSITKINFTSSVPPFNDDPNDATVNRLVTAQNITNDEQRIPRPESSITATALHELSKNILRKVYGGINKHKLTPDSWSQVMVEDSQALKRLKTLTSKKDVARVKAILSSKNEEITMDHLHDLVQKATKKHRKKKATNLNAAMWRSLMTQPHINVSTILKKHRPKRFFSLAYVHALRVFLEHFNAAEGTEYTLVDTLVEVYEGVDKLAPILSAAKQRPLTWHDAKSLQGELLNSWLDRNESIDEVLKLLKLKEKPLRYETLDTLVEYVALLEHITTAEALLETLMYLRYELGDAHVAQAIADGKKDVYFANQALPIKHGPDNTATEMDEHNELAEKLEAWLKQDLVLRYLNKNTINKSPVVDDKNRADAEAFDEKSLELSLKPPGA